MLLLVTSRLLLRMRFITLRQLDLCGLYEDIAGPFLARVVMTVVAIVIVILNPNDILVAVMGMLTKLWLASVIAVSVNLGSTAMVTWLTAMVTWLKMSPLRR